MNINKYAGYRYYRLVWWLLLQQVSLKLNICIPVITCILIHISSVINITFPNAAALA